MTPRRRLLLPLLALALVGCSGGDPKKEFIDEANGICEDAEDDFANLRQPTSVVELAPFAEKTLVIVQKAQRELAELTPPEQDRAELETRVLNPFAALVTEAEGFVEQVKAAGQDQAQLIALISKRPDPSKIDLAFLRSYGLGTCADAIQLGT